MSKIERKRGLFIEHDAFLDEQEGHLSATTWFCIVEAISRSPVMRIELRRCKHTKERLISIR